MSNIKNSIAIEVFILYNVSITLRRSNMNKAEFIKAVATKADLSIKDATAAVDAYTAVVAEALKAGDKVAIANFASYEIKEKAERQGFNPLTKQPITIAASKAPVVKFGKAFKDLFN